MKLSAFVLKGGLSIDFSGGNYTVIFPVLSEARKVFLSILYGIEAKQP